MACFIKEKIMRNYYKILEIEFGCDLLTIKKAYRRLAFAYHPDKNNSSNSVQKFIEITEAYEVLHDETKRKYYDKSYQDYYTSKIQLETDVEKQQEEWAREGKAKASEYSTISYEEFLSRAFKEIKVGVNYIPNLIAIVIVGIGAIGIMINLPDFFENDTTLGMIVLLFVFGLIYLTYRLAKVMCSDYSIERKMKINNSKNK